MEHQDSGPIILHAKFDRLVDDITHCIPATIAALFIPKFETIDSTFLYASFGKMMHMLSSGMDLGGTVEDLLKRDILYDPN